MTAALEVTCVRGRCTRKANRPGDLCGQHYRVTPHGFVDAAPAREHLQALRAAGYGWVTLAGLTGMSDNALRNVGRWTAQSTCTVDTLRRILAVPVPRKMVAGGAMVPAIGTARRVQALMVLGWSQTALAVELGCKDQRTVSWLINRRTSVGAETAARVAAAFDRLQWQVGPSVLAAKRAKSRGWFPPAAWDDIDDPNDIPTLGEDSPSALWEQIGERREQVAELTRIGLSSAAIAERLGVSDRSVVRDRTAIREQVAS